jgi:hypothetical protein
MEDAVHADKVLVLGYDWSRIYSAGQLMLINAIIATGKTTAYVSFGAPFHLRQIPRVHAFACGYCSVQPMQRVAVEVLLGRREAVGKLPVKPGMIT